MTHFTRINQPRVEQMSRMIASIRKSARSQKAGDDEVAALLAPIAALFGDTSETAPAPTKPKRPVWRDPPHIDQIARFVADVPSRHVDIYATHLVHRLCEMAETGRVDQ